MRLKAIQRSRRWDALAADQLRSIQPKAVDLTVVLSSVSWRRRHHLLIWSLQTSGVMPNTSQNAYTCCSRNASFRLRIAECDPGNIKPRHSLEGLVAKQLDVRSAHLRLWAWFNMCKFPAKVPVYHAYPPLPKG